MPDPTIGFIPKWLRDEPLDEHEPFFQAGSIPDADPRIVTRLVPMDHGYTLPARTVIRVIGLKQNLAYYAARDVVEGANPNFGDLTSLSRALRDAATLAIEPAEPGSYIIPARLPVGPPTPAPPVVDPYALVERYAELLTAVDQPERAAGVSIGALQVCRELGGLLRKDIQSIEITTYDRESAAKPTFALTRGTVERLDTLLARRCVTHRKLEVLTGRLEAVDIGKNTFQLKLDGHRQRVRGTGEHFTLAVLCTRLGETVTLEGDVVRERRSITMTAYRVVEADDE